MNVTKPVTKIDELNKQKNENAKSLNINKQIIENQINEINKPINV